MKNILFQIIEDKKQEIEQTKKIYSIEKLKEDIIRLSDNHRNFKKAILQDINDIHLIAEIKKASPSKGVLNKDIDVSSFAKLYEQAGASAISVLTEKKYFQGDMEYLMLARNACSIPILRKDFIVDEYQIFEAKKYGADAVLLIVTAINNDMLKNFLSTTKKTGLDALVEVHTKEELDIAVSCGAEIIGINNRSLENFKVNLETTEKLVSFLPKDTIAVSESGIHTYDDVLKLKKYGVNAILVGEAIVTSNDPISKIKELRGKA